PDQHSGRVRNDERQEQRNDGDGTMRLNDYLSGLKTHEASLGLALVELVRRADTDGVLDRGAWLAATRRAYVAHVADRHEPTGLFGIAADTDATAAPGAYLDDHVLARLAADGVASGEPDVEEWE